MATIAFYNTRAMSPHKGESEPSLDAALTRLKRVVHEHRIRLHDFLGPLFDKLRKGEMHPSQFVRGLSVAGIDRHLSAAEIQTICDHYTVAVSPSCFVMRYTELLAEVDALPHLETDPLAVAPNQADGLTDPLRFERSARELASDKEAELAVATVRVADLCAKRGIAVKPFFDMACKGFKGPKLFGHMTVGQLQQVMSVTIGIALSPAEASLIAQKYYNTDMPELINYVAFAHAVNPA